MNTVDINKVEKTKKLIDLPNDVCHRLAIKAAAMGTSVRMRLRKHHPYLITPTARN